MNLDETYMKQCLDLGQQSMELGHSRNDITYHAEIEAIRDALSKTGQRKLEGTTLYTTHEPCLMCTYAIRHYGIARVVYGLATGAIGGQSSKYGFLQADDIPVWGTAPQVISGVLEQACEALHQEYLSKKKQTRK